MASVPAWYAVPGSAWPGNTQPGRAGTLALTRTDITFDLGIPAFGWASGSARQDWVTGEPYGV